MSLLLALSLVSLSPIGPSIRQIENAKLGLAASVIVIPKNNNHGFLAIDDPEQRGDVRKHWRADYLFLINGGYFTGDFAPVGLNRIDSVTLSNKRSNLSGFVAIGKSGGLRLLTRSDDLRRYPTIIQSGPYLIDPGGKLGIKSDAGATARRTIIGQLKDGTIIIAATRPITLSGLARAMLAEFPTIDRLLNLDGGPSTAMKADGVEVLNYAPVRNYIGKRRKLISRRHPRS